MGNTCPVCNNAVSPEQAACPSCGFKLHGSTQEFAPLSMDGGKAVAPKPAVENRPASLTVLKGPQVGVRIVLSEGAKSMTVGRSPKCEVFLNDMTVSRRHAIIDRTEAGYRISDLNSFNGIWINNENVSSALLRDGDIIQIGAFCLRVEC
jgi:pSer/pThr/pTyr-binding forkhead associated (FHA) protein